MRVGSLEIQIMAGMARLQKDMNDAQRIVGGAMGNVEKSVASANRAMQALGVGLPLVAIVDQVRRMTDQYTKLDAQLRLATKSQEQYKQGMSDIRRISTVAQSDLSATSMLYTRLMNVMDGTGVSQAKLATVTETVSYGLKAYGATAQEASSAALQLSQAMGANRLGGEEFRAVMEAMPNVMKVVANSMGVPLGALRQLSIDGKITADVLVKALGDPAIAAEFKRMAESTQTITGAWVVARNELMLLVGEFGKSSGATGGMIAVFKALGEVFKFLAENMQLLLNAFYVYIAVVGTKLVAGLVQARIAQMALNVAHGEALVVNLAIARSEAANALVARDVAAARAWQTGVTTGLTAANARLAASSVAVAAAEKAQAAGSLSIVGRMKGAVGKAGWVGLALFGVWSVVDFLNGMQKISDGADTLSKKIADLTQLELIRARAKEVVAIRDMENAVFGAERYRVELVQARERVKQYDKQIDATWALRDAEFAARQQRVAGVALTHDEEVMQKRMIDLNKQFNDGNLTTAEYYKRVNDELWGATKAAKEATKAEKELNAIREASIKYEQDIVDAINAETDALLKKIEQERFDTEAIGKTAEQLALLQAVRYDNVTALQEQKLASLEANFASEAEIEATRQQIKARKELKGVWGTQAAAQARDAEKKAWKEIWDSVDKVAHDTFVSIMNGGKDTATRLKEAFKNGFFDWLYSMTAKKWIVNIGTSAAGIGASGTAMADVTGGGGGGSSWLTAGYSMVKMGLVGIEQSFTMMAGEISGALQSMGVAAETAGSIGVAGSYLGAGLAGITAGSLIAGDKQLAGMSGTTTSAVGSIIGAIAGGPLGAVIGGAIGGALNAAFGRGAKTSGTTTLAGQFTGAGFAGQYQTPWSQSGGWFSSGRSGVDVSPVGVAQRASLGALVAGSKSVFDKLIVASGSATKSLTGWTFAINRQVATQAQAEQLSIDLATSMGDYLIPELRMFMRDGENLADTAVRMKDTFVITDAALGLVGQTFNQIGLASMQMRVNLIDALGGIQQANASMQAYYQAFFSEEEKAVSAWTQMAATLRQLGIVDIPTTNAQFRALVEAQDLSTQSGQETFAALITMSTTFDALTKTTASLTSQTSKLATNLNLLSTDSFATLVDYTRYLRQSSGGVSTPFTQQVQSVLANAPTAAVRPTVQFSQMTQTASVTAPYSSTNPDPANVAAKLKAYNAWQAAESAAAISNSGRSLQVAEAARNAWAALPAFASGGTHTGGLRLVGENGPELEYTGPSKIYNNSDSRNMLDNSGVIASVDGLREELRAIGLAISAPIQKQYKLLDRWNGEGMPEVREVA